jgi:membrane protein implicated in regulation of membrane protease activity
MTTGRSVGTMGVFFVALGVLFFLLTLGLAFTIYGIIAAVLSVVFLGLGAWILSRGPSRGRTTDRRSSAE